MKALDDGHNYQLKQMKQSKVAPILSFYEMRDDGTIINGTTNEEVIKVLIDRIRRMNAKFPCRENAVAIGKLREALSWLERRTADREARGVEGKMEP